MNDKEAAGPTSPAFLFLDEPFTIGSPSSPASLFLVSSRTRSPKAKERGTLRCVCISTNASRIMSSASARRPTSPAFLFLEEPPSGAEARAARRSRADQTRLYESDTPVWGGQSCVGRTLLSAAFDFRNFKKPVNVPSVPYSTPIFLPPSFRSSSPQPCHSDRSRPPQKAVACEVEEPCVSFLGGINNNRGIVPGRVAHAFSCSRHHERGCPILAFFARVGTPNL